MASSLSVIIITTIVKLCNLFDSVRAPRKLVSLLLFFFLFLSLAFILPPSSPSSLPFLLFFPSYSTNIASGSARGTDSTTERNGTKDVDIKSDRYLPPLGKSGILARFESA